MSVQHNPVNWFEIPVSDLARAQSFYEKVLGIQMTLSEMGPLKMSWFPAEMTAPGAAGTLVLSEGYTPSKQGSLVYFSVSSVDAALARASENGGSTLLPRMPIGEYGFIGHFADSEGNRVGLHEAPAR